MNGISKRPRALVSAVGMGVVTTALAFSLSACSGDGAGGADGGGPRTRVPAEGVERR